MPHFVKTSGSTGLHVLIPLGARYTHEQSRAMAELLANCVVKQLPEIATVERQLEARGGKVYVDYLQNGHGRLLVAPYSVRPVSHACVSMPLNWKQVTSKLDMFRYTLRTVPELLARQKTDPFGELMTEVADLNRSLRLLADVV